MNKLTIQKEYKGKVAHIRDAGDLLDRDDWRSLRQHLQTDSSISTLYIEYSYLLTETDEMLHAIQKNRSLQCVHLKDSSIGKSLAKVIDALTENKKLNHLLVTNYREGDGEIDDAFMDSLAFLITNNSGLIRLNLEHISIVGKNFSTFCQALATTTSLKEMNLMYISLSTENRQLLLDALRANPSIKVLKLNCDVQLETALGMNPHSMFHAPSVEPAAAESVAAAP